MAKQNLAALYSIFGVVLWGDLGPVTMYRNHRGKIVAFAKSWPHKPASPEQAAQRAIFIAAATSWQTLSPEQKAQWHIATRRACLCLHGYDLFVHWFTSRDAQAMDTLERQTSTTLVRP